MLKLVYNFVSVIIIAAETKFKTVESFILLDVRNYVQDGLIMFVFCHVYMTVASYLCLS